MKHVYFFLILILLIQTYSLRGKLLINEVAPNTTRDWVEIKYEDEKCKTIDISSLYVTMYYGSNEAIALEPVTLSSCDKSSTPYDDRFAVVYLTESQKADETDRTGDTNKNGILDLYCNNYSSSLWNSDCVVAIDTDDDPSNGGIIDFLAFSNRDGTPNSTIVSYYNHAVAYNQWTGGIDFQSSALDIGADGLESFKTIARKNIFDTDSSDDFLITSFMTPGSENIFNVQNNDKSLIKVETKRLFYHINQPLSLFINDQCSIKIRIYTSTGFLIHTYADFKDLYPGKKTIYFPSGMILKKTGLYIGVIEAAASGYYKSEIKKFYIINRK